MSERDFLSVLSLEALCFSTAEQLRLSRRGLVPRQGKANTEHTLEMAFKQFTKARDAFLCQTTQLNH